MLKRIGVEHLREGMYLHELCGSWMEHPFWRTSFLLRRRDDIERILESGIREVWIDTARGLDVESGLSKEAVEAEIDQTIEMAVPKAATAPARVPLTEEIERAARICAETKRAIVSMFSEARMGRAVDAAGAAPLVEEIAESVARNPGALVSLARLKTADDYTYMHSVAVCGLMIALARELRLGEPQVREAGLAGLLHDVGKMAIPDAVLNKPGKLTDAEFTLVKTHPVEGHRMLSEARGATEVSLEVCLHHHEKVDGSGYPHRLPGERISLYAKMGAVCDVYDAITSDRAYKKGWDPGEALRKMASWAKGHFDETVFQAFVKSVGIYPAGSLVRLHSGRLGVVVEQSGTLLAPRVKVFFSTKSQARIPPETLDLAGAAARDRIVSCEDPARWSFPDLETLWRT